MVWAVWFLAYGNGEHGKAPEMTVRLFLVVFSRFHRMGPGSAISSSNLKDLSDRPRICGFFFLTKGLWN